LRLADMDAAGIDQQLLMLSSPGVQIFEPAEAVALARLANDRLAEAIARHPRRFAGLAAFAPQDPGAAARELERAVTRLGLKGGIVNSHTFGEYLDAPRYDPIFAAAEGLDVPIYVHPRAPSPQLVGGYLDHNLVGAIWGYAVETGLHALRLIFGGVFDRHPRLRIVIGHMGEGIPFFLDRIDTHHATGGGFGPRSARLKRRPSEYFREHFVVTTSGMNWEPALQMTLQVLGPERVLFAADYPFEDAALAVRRFDAMSLDPETRAMIAHRNAQRVFRLA
jgi:2,3-dihydroxybenzoate decarboxylase